MRKLAEVLDEHEEQLTQRSQQVFKQLHEQFKIYDGQVEHYDRQLEQVAKMDARCEELMKVEGVGPLSATAMVASVGDAKVFKNGREMAAWLGLVPKQHSSGNKIRLGGISKRGDRYLRTLLIHGARSVINTCEKKEDKKSVWAADKKKRCGRNKAAVALANKNARILWALLSSGECYRRAKMGIAA